MPKKIRLDLHLLTKGLASSRQQAQQLIRAGNVRSKDGQIFDKPGHEVYEEIQLEVLSFPKFVFFDFTIFYFFDFPT